MTFCNRFIRFKVAGFTIPFSRLLSIKISIGTMPLNFSSKKLISLKKGAFFGMSSMILPEIFIWYIPIIPMIRPKIETI